MASHLVRLQPRPQVGESVPKQVDGTVSDFFVRAQHKSPDVLETDKLQIVHEEGSAFRNKLVLFGVDGFEEAVKAPELKMRQ